MTDVLPSAAAVGKVCMVQQSLMLGLLCDCTQAVPETLPSSLPEQMEQVPGTSEGMEQVLPGAACWPACFQFNADFAEDAFLFL